MPVLKISISLHVSTTSLFMFGDVLGDLSPVSASITQKTAERMHHGLYPRRSGVSAGLSSQHPHRIPGSNQNAARAENDNKLFRARTPEHFELEILHIYNTNVTYTYLWPISVFIPMSGLIVVVPVCILLPIVLVRFGSDAETQKYGQYRANMTTMSHCAIPSIDAYHLHVSPRYSSALEQCLQRP